jgi:hypothetical protein
LRIILFSDVLQEMSGNGREINKNNREIGKNNPAGVCDDF